MTAKLRKLPIDVATFSSMIEDRYVYIDKTKNIHQLFTGDSRYYFFSRPRRFGKSLLISTLSELFAGNKKLFEGLWIATSDWEWIEHPVIHLDFSKIEHRTEPEFIQNLVRTLERIGRAYNADLSTAITPGAKLEVLVEVLSQKNKVVILIDEYDKPIIDHITNLEMAEKNRAVLKSFYDVIKSLDAHLRAIFVTGVSKFSKTSLFSGSNNLNDISQKPEAAALLGYTQQELEHYLHPYIAEMAAVLGTEQQAILDEMKKWYNGYRFSKVDLRVYNPFSVLYYLKDKERANYWVKSGTPTFLVDLLKANYHVLHDFSGTEVSDSVFNPFELTIHIPLIPLLYQTGYLTIETTFQEPDLSGTDTIQMYTLNCPNQEVREALFEYMLVALTLSDQDSVEAAIIAIRRSLLNNDIEVLCKQLTILFAQIPYQIYIDQESYFHSIFHVMLYLLGVRAQSEISTNKGRIDMVIVTKARLFLIEFKFDDLAQKAFSQINQKKYYEKYLGAGKPITLAGIAFNYKDKNLELTFVQKMM